MNALTLGSIGRLTSAEEIKWRLPLVDEFRLDGHVLRRDGARMKCCCPFHDERTPSCSITPERGLFHCFGCGAGGSVIDYHARKRAISPAAAIRELKKRLIGSGHVIAASRQQMRRGNKEKLLIPMRLDWLEYGTHSDLSRLAKLRCLSVEGLNVAQADGILRFGNLRGMRSWIITDETHAVAQARRLDGQRWEHLRGGPQPIH